MGLQLGPAISGALSARPCPLRDVEPKQSIVSGGKQRVPVGTESQVSDAAQLLTAKIVPGCASIRRLHHAAGHKRVLRRDASRAIRSAGASLSPAATGRRQASRGAQRITL